MRTLIVPIALVLGLLIAPHSQGATCKAANGWTIVTTPLEIGKTRVPGNTMVEVYDEQQTVVLAFSAQSKFAGAKPFYALDQYKIESVFQDKLGLHAFSWHHYENCLRCGVYPQGYHERSEIKIESEYKTLNLLCEKTFSKEECVAECEAAIGPGNKCIDQCGGKAIEERAKLAQN